MDALQRCGNCKQNEQVSYANGVWRETYCLHCSFESKVPSKKIENLVAADVSQRKKEEK